MKTRPGSVRALLLAIGLLALVVAVAIPALAASPAPSAAPSASQHPGKGPKESKAPEVAVTLRGVVGATTDADGGTTYTLTVSGRTLGLDAGPPWYWGDKNPLASSVGKTVTIAGSQRDDEVDVASVDGAPIREPGRPPWAGGWKAIGSAHPGWSQEKWDRWQARRDAVAGKGADPGAPGCWPPGQCKSHAPEGSVEPEGADEPAASGG